MDGKIRVETMVSGYRDAMVLVAALKTGIFESLGTAARTPAGLATDLNLDTRAVDIVVHALAASGILIKAGDTFSIDPEVRPYLLADSPDTMASLLGHNVRMMAGWLQLPTVLRTGKQAPRDKTTPEEMRDFICGMENVSRLSSLEVVDKVDFTSAEKLLDLGGGPGTAAITFCGANPDLKAVVFDLEGPVGIGAEQIKAAGMEDRITTVAGDFHTNDYGSDFDVVYISNIIHMLSEEETRGIFRRSRACLKPGGQILVKDFFLEDNRLEPAFAAQFSVNMLAMTAGGKSYTLTETLELLKETGFGEFSSIPVAKGSQVVCGYRES